VVDPDGTEIEIPLAEDGFEPDRCGGGVAHGALLVEAEVDVDVGTGEPDALHAPGRHARDVDRIAGGESGGVGELGRVRLGAHLVPHPRKSHGRTESDDEDEDSDGAEHERHVGGVLPSATTEQELEGADEDVDELDEEHHRVSAPPPAAEAASPRRTWTRSSM